MKGTAMARTTAQRRRQRAQFQSKLQHYTERSPRVPVKVTSNSAVMVPGSPTGDANGNCATIRDYPGYRRASRNGTGWSKPVNTNATTKQGGMSTYEFMREGMGYGY